MKLSLSKKIMFVVAVAGTLTLTGCGSADYKQPYNDRINDNYNIGVHEVPVNGKTVTCLVDSGITCDWGHPH